jgi:hypothetical protein
VVVLALLGAAVDDAGMEADGGGGMPVADDVVERGAPLLLLPPPAMIRKRLGMAVEWNSDCCALVVV